jgi:hypothetical protein
VTRVDEAGSAAAPVIARPITLTFQGDWGQANMHRICGWLAQEIGDRCAIAAFRAAASRSTCTSWISSHGKPTRSNSCSTASWSVAS